MRTRGEGVKKIRKFRGHHIWMLPNHFIDEFIITLATGGAGAWSAHPLWSHFAGLTIAIRSPKERITLDCSPLLGWVPREGDLRTIGREGEAH